MDNLGRICLPKKLRKIVQINDGDFVEIFVEGDAICIKGVKSEDLKRKCFSCGKEDKLVEKNGLNMCFDCVTVFYEGTRSNVD